MSSGRCQAGCSLEECGDETETKVTKAAPKKLRKTGNDWRPKLLKALAETGNITDACRRAGITRDTFYRHRHEDPAFAAAAADALEVAVDNLELEARRRAEKGCEKPVFYKGREIARITEYSDTLLIFLLKAHRPEKYRERYDVSHGGELAIHPVIETIVRTREEARALSALPPPG